MQTCPDELIVPPDMNANCVISIGVLITRLYYGPVGWPLVLETPTTDELAIVDVDNRNMAILTRTLALRTAANAVHRIVAVDIFKGQMPKASPKYKMNPASGQMVLDSSDTDMQVTFTEYDAAKAKHDFWKALSKGSRQRLFWFENGGQLIGGLSGIKASISAVDGIIDGSEVSNQTDIKISWKGDPMPEKLLLA